MKNLNLKTVIISGVFNLIILQVVSSVLGALIPTDAVTSRMIQTPIIFVLVAFSSYYVFKSSSLKKIDAAVQGFLSGIIASALIMFIAYILSSFVFTMGIITLILASALGGYLAGKK